MSKTKELIICLISVAVLILAITTSVFATEVQDLTSLMGNNNTTENNDFEEITENNLTTNNTNSNTAATTNNTNTNTNVNKTTTMPYTGVNYSVVVIIAVCGVSAIYAYKKISDYKNV